MSAPFNLKMWWQDPNLTPLDQHPIAHALGGLVFVALAAFDLSVIRHGAPLLAGVAIAVQLLAALPIVRRENVGRRIRFDKIIRPLVTVLGTGTLLALALPAAWQPWAIATALQATWEVLQVGAWWDDARGESLYAWQSGVLDAATASLTAAALTLPFVL